MNGIFNNKTQRPPKKSSVEKRKQNLKFGKVVIMQNIFAIIHYQTKNGMHSIKSINRKNS
jgi:hypothetical protein